MTPDDDNTFMSACDQATEVQRQLTSAMLELLKNIETASKVPVGYILIMGSVEPKEFDAAATKGGSKEVAYSITTWPLNTAQTIEVLGNVRELIADTAKEALDATLN